MIAPHTHFLCYRQCRTRHPRSVSEVELYGCIIIFFQAQFINLEKKHVQNNQELRLQIAQNSY